MTESSRPGSSEAPAKNARDWVQILAKYRDPDPRRSAFELAVTLIPFLLIWAAALWLMADWPVLSVLLACLNAGFLVRLFAIQHDCGHASFFRSRQVSDWTGRALSILTLTPYDVWRRTHSIHHASAGNLDKRGIGDVHTLTVAEYKTLTPWAKFRYRLYRSPVVLFLLGPSYLFLLQNRLPFGLMGSARYWLSAMATNAAILGGLALLVHFAGWPALLLIWLPTTVLAATAGVWMFYVQHQFEETEWLAEPDWQLHDAALKGSSHYDLPAPLAWMTANLGIHHVHHLYSRIPFYRLPEVLRDHPSLATAQRMTIRESLATPGLQLWDEATHRLVSFRWLRRQAASQ